MTIRCICINHLFLEYSNSYVIHCWCQSIHLTRTSPLLPDHTEYNATGMDIRNSMQLRWSNWDRTSDLIHYDNVIMSTIASLITSLTIVYSIVYSDADQRKHQSSASLAFVRGIHRGPVNSPHKWPVTRKMFPFDDVIMISPCVCSATKMPNIKHPYQWHPYEMSGDCPESNQLHFIIM